MQAATHPISSNETTAILRTSTPRVMTAVRARGALISGRRSSTLFGTGTVMEWIHRIISVVPHVHMSV